MNAANSDVGGERSAELAEERWDPAHFILEGRYCPVEQVAETLEEKRRRWRASSVLLLVADRRAVLRSLCFIADPECGFSATQELRAIVNRIRGLQDLIRPPGLTGARAANRYPQSTSRILAELHRGASEQHSEALGELLASGHSWLPLQSHGKLAGGRVACAVLAANPERLDGEVFNDAGSFLTIAEMVNSTAHAHVRRDAITSELVDTLFDPAGVTLDATGVTQIAGQLVHLARIATESDAAAFYELGPAGNLMLAAADASGVAVTSVPSDLDPADSATAAVSIRRRRAVQYPSSSATEEIVPTLGEPTAAGGSWLELSTPVLGSTGSPKLPLAGVLVVARGPALGGGRAEPYGAYEYALARNVALRMTLFRAASDLELVGRSYAALMRVDRDADASDQDAVVQDHWDDRPLPDDLAMVRNGIEATLADVARVTASHSATFRAALPHHEVPGHGLALVRIAASPPLRQADRLAVQRPQDGGINWRAALKGKPDYSPDVEADEDYREVRPETRSELSVPVFVGEQLIGVMNLESTSPNGYADRLETAAMLAAAVGTRVSSARLELSRPLQALAIEVATKRHDFAGDAKQVKNAAARASPELRPRLLEISKTIDRRARTLRHVAAGERPNRGTLMELFERVRADVGIDVEMAVAPVGSWTRHAGAAASSVRESLRHIVTNVKEHRDMGAGPGPCVRFVQAEWAGRRYEVIHVEHRFDGQALLDQKAVNVYRVPLTPSPLAKRGAQAMPRFGAYLAGMQARELGGDVYLCKIDDEWVRVSALFPSRRKSQLEGA